jgi:hypothetical protein
MRIGLWIPVPLKRGAGQGDARRDVRRIQSGAGELLGVRRTRYEVCVFFEHMDAQTQLITHFFKHLDTHTIIILAYERLNLLIFKFMKSS